MHTEFWREDLKGRHCLEDIEVGSIYTHKLAQIVVFE
jgi:hypothetical protein